MQADRERLGVIESMNRDSESADQTWADASKEDEVLGVSIVICCCNSAKRLPPTLTHLAALEVSSGVPWEVIVVDHASRDGTKELARKLWPADPPAPLRVVDEPRPGLANARDRGLRDANYPIVSFLDDDNWVMPGWIDRIVEVMTEHPEVAALGGYCEAVCETDPPEWFGTHQLGYAVGPQGIQAGDITDERTLWGAGLTLRKAAWNQLLQDGFHPLLQGGPALGLMACEDNELGLALRMAGWRAWYEPRMRLKHFVPANRLTWEHLRQKERRGGRSSAGLDPYHFAVKPPRRGPLLLLRYLRQTWQWQLLSGAGTLLRRPTRLARFFFDRAEGNPDVLVVESQIGRLAGLLRIRREYRDYLRTVRDAAWRRDVAETVSAGAAALGNGGMQASSVRGARAPRLPAR